MKSYKYTNSHAGTSLPVNCSVYNIICVCVGGNVGGSVGVCIYTCVDACVNNGSSSNQDYRNITIHS